MWINFPGPLFTPKIVYEDCSILKAPDLESLLSGGEQFLVWVVLHDGGAFRSCNQQEAVAILNRGRPGEVSGQV